MDFHSPRAARRTRSTPSKSTSIEAYTWADVCFEPIMCSAVRRRMLVWGMAVSRSPGWTWTLGAGAVRTAAEAAGAAGTPGATAGSGAGA